ncbi:MAG: PEP-CTERM sorting domain-containing protein [Gammaproteobacteria bacterium]|nr:PEP-CTERM sorting domain-containing protein [Gammaproteobacteria bacterium]MBU1776779.1 PEP-CTERM sorting domain-containing protein [Gammaproteobacteria bacterium]MBU1969813.1 PEP-CTERM sorting domain-containing protein [Gammaproteobacteria bacterium]
MNKFGKKLAATFVVLAALFAGSTNAAELITNGGFEDGMNGWSCTGADLCTSTNQWYPVHSGSFNMLGFDNLGYATLSQSISTTIGSSYDFSFFSAATQLAGNVLGYSFSDYAHAVFVPTTTSWLQTTDSFIANAGITNIQFYFATDPGTGTWRIDDVSVQDGVMTPVPEPETYAMLLVGLALLGFTTRRRGNDFA